MPEVRESLDRRGHSPFAAWSDGLNKEAAAAKVAGLEGLHWLSCFALSCALAEGHDPKASFGPPAYAN